jgi:hypothetical protein
MSSSIDPEMRELIEAAGGMLISAVMSAGVDEATAKKFAQPKFLEIMGSVEETGEEIGTLWATGRKAKTKQAKQFINQINEDLDDKYSEGVRDEDIVNWWNTTEVARRIMFEQFNMMRTGIMIFVAQNFGDQFENMDEIGEYAAGRSRGVTPFFTFSPNPGNKGNEARGLPMELIPRVVEWLANFEMPGYDVPNGEIQNLNARIRKEIAAGKL